MKTVSGKSCKLIFIVENDHQTRVDLRSLYEARGHVVVSAATPGDALKLLDNISTPDIVLIGRDFPLYSSSKFISALKNNERFQNVPLVALQKNGECVSKNLSHNVNVHNLEILLSIVDKFELEGKKLTNSID